MHTPNITPTYFTTLTPLGGIAALLVVNFHSNLFLAPVVDPAKAPFVKNGWLWPVQFLWFKQVRAYAFCHIFRPA